MLINFLTSKGQEEVKDIKKAPLQGFNISGNYRFYGQHRIFTDAYTMELDAEGNPIELDGRSILIGDATQLPELTLNISGSPAPRTSFGTDLIVWNQNNGDFQYYRNLQLGINLYGDFNTDYGNVGIKMGGIHWVSLTSFTMKSFFGYNRFSLFERNPWDPQFKDIDKRYSEYYEKGAITQDSRWSNQAFQGLMLDITEMPYDLNIKALYGKTQNTGGLGTGGFLPQIDSDNTIPNYAYGGMLIKNIGENYISLNTFNTHSYLDLLATEPLTNHIYTSSFGFYHKYLNLSGEIGVGKYMDLDMGEMITVKTRLNEKLIKIPIEFHYYRISPNVVNPASEFVNTSVVEYPSASTANDQVIGSNGVLQQTGSALLGIGQMANNREGLNINTDIKIKNLTLTIGNGVSKELIRVNNQITYGHTINGLTMSRFWRWSFPSSVGAYNKLSVLYRGVYETLTLTDQGVDGTLPEKHFNTIETQAKYKFDVLNRPWYIFYLGSFSSVQSTFSPITVFTEEAYLRVYSHQLENYYSIHPKLVLVQYLGWERIIANYNTLVNIDSRRPINQEGVGIGFGLDYMMAKNTGLYLRHRVFQFEDTSFAHDKFAGHESTVEVKIYF